MSTLVQELQDQAQKFWAPLLVDELKENSLLPSLVNSDYEGDLKQQGDTVYVSMVKTPSATRKAVGSGHETFETSKLQTVRKGIVANQVITAGYELDNLIDLQTQLGSPEGKSKIRDGLFKALELSVNEYLYSLVSPTTSSPVHGNDHVRDSISAYNQAQILIDRKFASQAKWMKDNQWYLLLDPCYYNDLLGAQTLTSSDYVPDQPVVGGQIVNQRFGFNILEDNSDGMHQISPTAATDKLGLAFHRDFMYMVMQQEAQIKISDKHVLKQHGYIMSASLVVGAELGIEGDVKHITIFNA